MEANDKFVRIIIYLGYLILSPLVIVFLPAILISFAVRQFNNTLSKFENFAIFVAMCFLTGGWMNLLIKIVSNYA